MIHKISNTVQEEQVKSDDAGLNKVRAEIVNLLQKRSKYSLEALEMIQSFGGKAASLLWQFKKGNGKYLPPCTFIQVNSDGKFVIPASLITQEAKASSEIGYMFSRASASGDEKGLVGTLKSDNGYGYDSLEEFFTSLIEDAKSDSIMQYAKYFDGNIGYDGVQSIIVSPLIAGENGSVVEHPNMPNHYVVNFLNGNLEFLVDGNGKIKKRFCMDVGINTKMRAPKSSFAARLGIEYYEANIPQIIQMKKDTDAAGFISGLTTQTEFVVASDEMHAYLNGETEEFDVGMNEKVKFREVGFEYTSIEKRPKVFFLQQREFRPYGKILTIEPKKYTFNTFGESPETKDLVEVSDIDMPVEVPQEPFHMLIHSAMYTKKILTNVYPNEEGGMLIYKLINSPFLRGITFVKDHGNGSLEHGCYRFMNRDVPIRTIGNI